MLCSTAAIAIVLTLGQAARPPLLRNVSKIVALGDSITAAGTSPKGFLTLIGATLDSQFGAGAIEVVNAGIGGQKAPDMLMRFQTDVVDRHPQLVTISVGVNDVWHNFRNAAFNARVPSGDSGRGVALPLYIKDVEDMVSQAQKAGIQVVLLSPTLVYEDLNCAENSRLIEYVKAEHAISEKFHVPFINLNQVFRTVVADYQRQAEKRSLLLTVDGVHMNNAGNALMADQILKTLGISVPDTLAPH
jgi:lysophospholipase L1-like esterase